MLIKQKIIDIANWSDERLLYICPNQDDAHIYGQLCEDMIKNCADEVALRDAELAALEKEINPMLSDDKNVAFRSVHFKWKVGKH